MMSYWLDHCDMVSVIGVWAETEVLESDVRESVIKDVRLQLWRQAGGWDRDV